MQPAHAQSVSVEVITDGGPIYTETQLDRFIVEPLNASSNVLFLIIAVFWALRVYREPQPNRFLGACLPVLFLGFVGGTVYHAFRAHPFWLLLDWLPIFGLTVAASVRYVRKLSPPWAVVGLSYGIPFLCLSLIAASLPEHLIEVVMPALGYTTLALWVLAPLVAYVVRHPGVNWRPIVSAVGLFVAAITFRSLDRLAPFPFEETGTHFLWHIFGAASAHFVVLFIYLDDKRAAGSAPLQLSVA